MLPQIVIMFKILTIGIYLITLNLITTVNACIDNMIPVAVEFGEVGCASNPICVEIIQMEIVQ